ncbi:hypothetical protein QR685DRAFT_597258 [Neurospora intermedia]|uniref:Uncharacterized protein n=1 Tax=Neurospora intermedia TaxID=5142 RepID=A0ABR3DD92_NEUIN
MKKRSVSITEGEKDGSGGWGEMNGPVVIVKESEGRGRYCHQRLWAGFVEEKMLGVEEAGVVITVTDTAADFETWKLFEDVVYHYRGDSDAASV